ncbi:MAG: response regulator [Thermodesulfovibrionales bacterium]
MSHKPSVLVADGSEACAYISIVLNRMGFTVIPVQNGQDALEMTRRINPDVAIIDADLPKENGIALLKEIRADRFISDTQVIMMSTSTIDEVRDKSKGLGCDAYLIKPINIMKLHNELQEVISFPGGRKRKFVRVAWNEKISLGYKGLAQKYDTVSISEGGMYVKAVDQVPRGTAVSGTLPVNDLKILNFNGAIIYTRGVSKQFSDIIPGMAIAFNSLSNSESHFLRRHIVKLLTRDISGMENHIKYM